MDAWTVVFLVVTIAVLGYVGYTLWKGSKEIDEISRSINNIDYSSDNIAQDIMYLSQAIANLTKSHEYWRGSDNITASAIELSIRKSSGYLQQLSNKWIADE